jgi:hypothetical protein
MANKKINQLVLKTTIQPTDLFPLGDASTGQLFKKTVAELQAAIGGAVISVNGLVGTVVLDTDDIQELASPTNRYFTEARARAAISLTTTGNSGASTYSNSTGVLNVPTYTLAGLGGITASFLSGGTGITYNSGTGVIAYSGTVYTDASVRALVSAGAGLSYNSSTGVFSYSGTVYTDASIRALISLTTSGSSGASTYNNTTGVLNIPTYTLAGLGGISLTSLSGSAPITYNSSTGAIGITQASGSTNGFLSSTDWNTFNGKQSALTLGNVTEAVSNVLMFPDGQNGKTIGNLSIQVVQAGSTTNGFLSTTDWNTFNNKQNAITLTTTGTSGAATFTSNTLNIPQYQAALTNPVTGTGTTNYVTKWTSSSAIGISQIFDNGTNIGIRTTTPQRTFEVIGTTNDVTTASFGRAIPIGNWTGIHFGYSETTNADYRKSALVFERTGTAGQGKIHILNNNDSDLTSATLANARITITAAGNVGISTTSPGATLDVQSSSGVGSSTASGLARFITAGTTPVISVGQANSGRRLDIFSANILVTGEQFNLGTNSANPVIIDTNNVERFRVTSSGEFGFNTSSPSRNYVFSNPNSRGAGGFEITAANNLVSFLTYNRSTNAYLNLSLSEGSTNVLIGTSTDNGERLYVSGSIRATGSITANSDVRLKKNIERIENALQKVSEISGYTYNTIYDEDRHAGVIAQEIDKVLPEIVNKGNDGLMGVEYGNISALLIEAIKEQKGIIDNLQARLSALEK